MGKVTFSFNPSTVWDTGNLLVVAQFGGRVQLGHPARTDSTDGQNRILSQKYRQAEPWTGNCQSRQ